jgi:radical SAM protein with 4Fe4S-binding SPASM domain
VIRTFDKKHKFVSLFDPKSGLYIRSGIIEDGKDTGVDPFMASGPQLCDVGIMGHCPNGLSGKCLASGVQCYQDGLHSQKPHMTLDNFKRIVDQCKGVSFQFALGGCGDPNLHPNFKEILRYCRDNYIVPNYTTSGLGLTDEMVETTKSLCGAVAVSFYRNDATAKAIDSFLKVGMKTNIHYVLGNNSIDEAVQRLRDKSFPEGINAVIFLLHKPVGLGREDNVLKADDPRVKEFFELVNSEEFPHKIGFDSCSVQGILNFAPGIDRDSIDSCEGARFSMYIAPSMVALPCSFDQAHRWAYDISNDTIHNAWNSPQFEDFRNRMRNACPGCAEQRQCLGGCPIKPQVVLCNREEREVDEG